MQSKYNAACLNCFNINNFYFSKKSFQNQHIYLFKLHSWLLPTLGQVLYEFCE